MDLAANKTKVVEHYDNCSPYYQDLWGKHIHHGYWRSGKETKEVAQVQLIDKLITASQLATICANAQKKGNQVKVLDVGCGVGGSSIYLAKKFSNVNATGVTISKVQVEMATKNAAEQQVTDRVQFKHIDADTIIEHFPEQTFDVVWVSEALSHFTDKKIFFQSASKLLKQGGKFVVVDWFRAEHLSPQEFDDYVKPIEIGMFVPGLASMTQYASYMSDNAVKVQYIRDISDKVYKTWDLCLDLIVDPSLWKLAYQQGPDFIGFLKAFNAMKNGFSSQAFVYGIVIGEKAGHMQVTESKTSSEKKVTIFKTVPVKSGLGISTWMVIVVAAVIILLLGLKR